ncbi:MAG: 3-phosphoshikimate 1-carboxyvinyltransferase [Caulobacterales bacterium]|uniref:3-phosphoshikimate 1-carboxyvinyltransferase n=1 Tax=Glycocaulis sp. TaxID=1969725 RepID=UPI003F9FA3F3
MVSNGKAGVQPTVSGGRTSRKPVSFEGQCAASPDKSISHRAIMLAGMAEGTSRIEGLLESADVLATAGAVQALGADVKRGEDDIWQVTGRKTWTSPAGDLDLGNSGTGVRLLMGAAARFDLTARFTGDESLSSRPMERVLAPLRLMGVTAEAASGGRLPVTMTGRAHLKAIEYTPPVASAQVKSGILLAGLGADGETIVIEPHATRAHTETLAPVFGADMDMERDGAALIARVRGGRALKAADIHVPGDPSSAAFPLAAGLVAGTGPVTVTGIMTNPARFGLYEVLQAMGAQMTINPAGQRAGEALADITVRPGTLRGIEVPPEIAPSMIDEYPILSVIAACAEGVTHMTGLAELRAKESDRLAASAALLSANGVKVELGEDSLTVHGMGAGGVPGGGLVKTLHDHRLAMAGLVLGLGAKEPVTVDDVAMIATSYPGFFDDMAGLGAVIG